LYLDAAYRVLKEPQPVVVNARMRNAQLLSVYLWMRELKLLNDYIDVPHTFPLRSNA
jgi:hypothetical protein